MVCETILIFQILNCIAIVGHYIFATVSFDKYIVEPFIFLFTRSILHDVKTIGARVYKTR